MQMTIDDRCSDEQAKAIEQIGSGRETVEASTVWWVYATMCDTHHEVLRERIDVDIDMDARTARCSIKGVLEASGEPIRSPLNGSPHRVRIQVPHGIEFETAVTSCSVTGNLIAAGSGIGFESDNDSGVGGNHTIDNNTITGVTGTGISIRATCLVPPSVSWRPTAAKPKRSWKAIEAGFVWLSKCRHRYCSESAMWE